MKGQLFEGHEQFFDHDVLTCPVCQPTNNYFGDMPCPQCGHIFDEGGTRYFCSDGVNNFRTDFNLCNRCRIAVSTWFTQSVFSYDQTGPGDDLSGYELWKN